MRTIKNIFLFLATVFFLVFGFLISRTGFPFGVDGRPAVALADDDEEEEEERNNDEEDERDDEEEEIQNPTPIPAPVVEQVQVEKKVELKPEVATTFVKLPDQVIEEQILTTIYDSDGDGVFDSEDPTPNLHNVFTVKDDNFNGIADIYEQGE